MVKTLPPNTCYETKRADLWFDASSLTESLLVGA